MSFFNNNNPLFLGFYNLNILSNHLSRKKGIENVQKTFMLTEGEKYLLLECGLGEGIFFAGKKHAAIKIVASVSEDQLITSNPEQMLESEDSKREFEDQ